MMYHECSPRILRSKRGSRAPVTIRMKLKNGAIETYRGVGYDYAQTLVRMTYYNMNFWADHPNGDRMFRQITRDRIESVEIVS